MSVIASQKVNSFFSGSKAYRYKKGEIILRGGDVPQGIYFINKGYVRDYSISKDGEELTLIIFKPQDFFPMNWVFNNTPNFHYFEAMTPVELWRFPKEKFTTFLKTNPDVFFELASHISLRLGGLLQRMEYLAFGNAREKVASILIICAERFGKKDDRGVRIPIPLTHKDLAMLVGMTRETVSIEMKKLERKGIIEDNKRSIIVTSMKKLRLESLDENS